MSNKHVLSQTIPERPILELACTTWMSFEKLYRDHILTRRLVLPPSAVPHRGPVLVTVTLPSGDILRLDATVGRVYRNTSGRELGTEVHLQELSYLEQQALSRYAARKERGWSAPPMPKLVTDRVPASGIQVRDDD